MANGNIKEAYGPFAGWQERNVHGSGLAYLDLDGSGILTGLPKGLGLCSE